MHVVSEWVGHSIETMKKFYLQVTDEHREAALQVKPNPKPLMPDTPRHAAQQKSQNAVVYGIWLGVSGPVWPFSSGRGTRTPDTRIMIPLL